MRCTLLVDTLLPLHGVGLRVLADDGRDDRAERKDFLPDDLELALADIDAEDLEDVDRARPRDDLGDEEHLFFGR